MSDAEDKARQEKLAAIKRRADQLRKKKAKQASAKKDETAESSTTDAAEPASTLPEPDQDDDKTETTETTSPAQQSKLRTASFRAGGSPGAVPLSPGPLSPDGDTAADIYRRHVAKIEELEKENKRLTKETADLEKRWQKSEAELADLREADGNGGQEGKDGETEKLRSEIESLERQNSQLQQQIARGHGHAHRPSVSMASPELALQAELDAKSATIESMEIEISKLKARVDRQENEASSDGASDKEQILALEDKVARAEAAAGKAQRELQDVKKNLDRATEKAVREGSERSSAETKANALEGQLEEATKARDELEKRADGLEKKVAALTTLHKEQDSRYQALRKDKEKMELEATALKEKVEKLESQNAKLASRRSTDGGGGGGLDDEGVDELENEGRLRLEKKIRSLEAEIHELRSGAWIERRREMEASSSAFHDVDLSSGSAVLSPGRGRGSVGGGGGIGDFIAHGLNALAGGGAAVPPVTSGGGGDDDLLEDDDDMGFDEDAFRRAHEEQARRRLERIKEIKRSLKHWEGWRLDIVDIRRGGGGQGIGEIFDV